MKMLNNFVKPPFSVILREFKNNLTYKHLTVLIPTQFSIHHATIFYVTLSWKGNINDLNLIQHNIYFKLIFY